MNYDKIKEQFKEVLAYSQEISDPKVDDLFLRWEKAKSYFIEKFNGQLIYEVPEKQVFYLSDTVKKSRIDDFIERLRVKYCASQELLDFVNMEREQFFENTVSIRYKIEKDNTIIPKGMKLLKAFKYFIHNKEILMDVQNDASRVIQENKVEGKLCFSVHPLDFLSLSENNCNWRSCHSLDGEYRAGNLSYMIDKSTFICYLKADSEDVKLPNFPNSVKWNNKKWRVLLFLSNDQSMLMAGRQYPFASDGALSVVLQNMFFTREYAIKWHDWMSGTGHHIDISGQDFSLDNNYYVVGYNLLPKHKFIFDNPYSCQFNDLLRSSYYEPVYSLQICRQVYFPDETYLDRGDDDLHFYIGGSVNCINCGTSLVEEEEDCMLCSKCSDELNDENCYTCEYCGCRIPKGEEYYTDDDIICCEHCFNEHIDQCDNCKLYFDLMTMHSVMKNGEIYRYCSECWEDMTDGCSWD